MISPLMKTGLSFLAVMLVVIGPGLPAGGIAIAVPEIASSQGNEAASDQDAGALEPAAPREETRPSLPTIWRDHVASLGGMGDDAAYHLARTEEGGFVLAGAYQHRPDEGDDTGTGTVPWLLHFDPAGRLAWQRVIGPPMLVGRLDTAIQEPGGGFLLGGRIDGFSFLARADTLGLPRLTRGGLPWFFRFGDGGDDLPVRMHPLAESRHSLAIGTERIEGPSGASRLPFVLRIDGEGQPIAKQALPPDEQKAWHYHIADSRILRNEAEGHALVLAGWRETPGNRASRHGFIMGLGSDGQRLWQRSLGETGQDFEIVALDVLPSGTLIAAGQGHAEFRLFAMNDKGKPVWETSLSVSPEQGDAAMSEAGLGPLPSAAGDKPTGRLVGLGLHDRTLLVLASHSHEEGAGRDIRLIALDHQGKPLWERLYGDEGDDLIHQALPTRDGGFLLAGTSTSLDESGRRDILLFKIDARGELAPWRALEPPLVPDSASAADPAPPAETRPADPAPVAPHRSGRPFQTTDPRSGRDFDSVPTESVNLRELLNSLFGGGSEREDP